MERTEILYDHYKDTFEQQKIFIKKRNTYTYFLLGIITLFAFQRQDLATTEIFLNAWLKEHVGDISIRITYINTVLSIIYFLVCMTYFSISLNIERLYNYIHKLEVILKHSGLNIEREGFAYLNSYPWMLWCTHRIYQIILPLGLIFISILQISDYADIGFTFYTILNIFIYAITILLTLLYLSYIHFNEQYFDHEKFPNLKWYQRFYRYLKNDSSDDN